MPLSCPFTCRRWRIVLSIFILAAADQLSKWWMFEHVLRVSGEPRALSVWLQSSTPWQYYGAVADFADRTILPFANLVMVWNRGVSFGLFASGGAHTPVILIGVAALMTLVLGWWLARAHTTIMRAALALIIAGALSNMFDRLRFGAVADFIDLHVAGYHWPAFNIADSAIVIGAALLLADSVLSAKREEKKQ